MLFKRLAASAVRTVLAPVKVDRRVARMVAGSTAVVAAVLGLNLATAGPAAAAETERGRWKPYGNTNPISSSESSWGCGPTKPIESDVTAQLCAVRTPDQEYAQAAVIVRNNRSSVYGAEAAAELSYWRGRNLGRWECSRSGIAANSWSVCFGTTTPVLFFSLVLAPAGGVNGVNLERSPSV